MLLVMNPHATKAEIALSRAAASQWTGVTYCDLVGSGAFDGHGSASAVLSRLHEKDLIVRLAEQDEGCSRYVLPKFAGTRPLVPHRSRSLQAAKVETSASDLATLWAMLGKIASCNCACDCGARAELEVVERKLKSAERAA